MRTLGKPQIKATSTCPSANSSKDSPTLRVVWQPTLSPTYLAMCAYVEYIMGERNVEKRSGVVLSSIHHPLRPSRKANPYMVGATLAVALAAKRIGSVLSLMHHPLRP